jgi:F-type H+-transporting ATPase subunit epsilon
MKLEIVTPDQFIFSGDVNLVNLPGKNGSFSIKKDHAPLIASLKAGVLSYVQELNHYEFVTGEGVMEVKDNKITVCVENAVKKVQTL